MKVHNPNCDGDHCHFEKGGVRVYPLGAGGNLILCRSCWTHENAYRLSRGGERNDFPLIRWEASEVYNTGA